MARKIILLLSCVFCLQFVVAQTMSDEDIKSFILAEQEKGASKQAIARMLLKKGVTPERLREINDNDENETSLLGVSDLNDKKTIDSRLREKNETPRETEALEKVESTMEAIDKDPVVFGRNIFNNRLLTFESSKNIPIPSNYVLGAGDVVIIDIWGASQNLIEAEISPEGRIVVAGVGPLHLAGKNVNEANRYVNDVLGKMYAESSINLSVGTTRSIVVQVLGEVRTPGNYTLSALSTAFNALYAAGGIGRVGTLRSINVFRAGKKIATIDVYDYIFNGNTAGNVTLQDNDVISVGAYDAIVNIQGKVKRPMLYEMKGDETLASLVKYSGGFTGDAYSEKVRVVRKSGREFSLHTVEKQNMGAFNMSDGDVVYVDSIIQRFSNMVEISGAVFFPGQYQFGEDINSITELIEAAGGVREDAFLNRAVLQHRNHDNTIEAMSVDIKGIMNGTADDVALRNNDVLFIPSDSEMKGEQLVTIDGEINFPGVYKFAENTTIEDLILQAGGLTRAASMAKVDVYRSVNNPYALAESDTLVEMFTFEIKDGFVVDGEVGFVLQPFDEVNIRRSPAYENIKNVEILGAVLHQGTYALASKNMRLSDLVEMAGGVSSYAYLEGASLLRRVTKEDAEQRELLHNLSKIDLYEDLLVDYSSENLALLDPLMKYKMGDGSMYPVAIDMKKAIEDPESVYNIVLREGDIITVPEYVSTVKVKGEIKYPTVLNWRKGKSLKYYVKHAGGFSEKAKKNGIYVINMNGSVEKLPRLSKKVAPGSEIVVPRKKARRSMTTGEIVTIGTSTASLATMIVTLVNLLGGNGN